MNRGEKSVCTVRGNYFLENEPSVVDAARSELIVLINFLPQL
jgi:hypothetical protein